MKLHTTAQFAEYCDNLENHKRYGAQFWREGFGIQTKDEARAIMPELLDAYLRPEMRNFGETLIQRFSVSASDARKDAGKHLSNAFPTLKGIGIVTRKGANAKPTKAYAQAGEDRIVTVIRDLENGETFSCCIAWLYADVADISDKTEVSPVAIGDYVPSAAIDATQARVVGTDSGSRYDVAYTPQAVGELLSQAVNRSNREQYDAVAIHNRNIADMVEFTLSCVSGYDGAGPSIAKMFPMAQQATSEAIEVSTSRNARNASRKMTA